MFSNIMNVLFIGLTLLCWFLVIKKFVGDKFAPVKSVKAEVFDKFKTNTVSRIQGSFKREHYVVVFSTSGEKLSFYVSEFSYSNYNINDKGTLKYKGNQIISFG